METFISTVGTFGLAGILLWLAILVGKKPAIYCPKHERMCDCRTHPRDKYFLPPM